ncbi:MAG: cohesin domain-containing protein [Candidatus Krumholzibacteriia bacterium]
MTYHGLRRCGGWLPAAVALAGLLCAGGPAARAATNLLYISPPISAPTDSLFTVAVVRNAGDAVQGFDVKIAFDPAVVRLDGITPGDWLLTPGYPFAFFNSTAAGEDTLRFSAAFLGLGQASGAAGVVAVLHFRARALGVSPLGFAPVVARDVDNAPVPFDHSVGDRIVIDQVIAAWRPSFGGVKGLYR